MKDIERALTQEYPEISDHLTFSDKSKLSGLYDTPKHTAVHRAIVIQTAMIVAAVTLLLSGTTAVAIDRTDIWGRLHGIISEGTADLNISEEKRSDLTDRMVDRRLLPSQAADWIENFKVNKYGETIGALDIGADLQKVGCKDSDISGYIYRYDYGIYHSFVMLDEENMAMNKDGTRDRLLAPDSETGIKRNWVYVFDEDGTEIVGKMEVNSYQFYSNEALKDPNISKFFREGSFVDVYDSFVQERTDYKLSTGKEMPIPQAALPDDYYHYDVNTDDTPSDGSVLEKYYFSTGDVFSQNAIVYSNDESAAEALELIPQWDETTILARIFIEEGEYSFTIIDGNLKHIFTYESINYPKGMVIRCIGHETTRIN